MLRKTTNDPSVRPQTAYIGIYGKKTVEFRISMIFDVFFEVFFWGGPSVRVQRLSRAASILTFQSGSIRAIRRPRFQVRILETSIWGGQSQVWREIDHNQCVLRCLSSRPGVSLAFWRGRCHDCMLFTATLRGRQARADPAAEPPIL